MNYETVKEASIKWNISERRICILCKEGRIAGAVKKSGVWMIPGETKKPDDGRAKCVLQKREPLKLYLNPDYFGGRSMKNVTRDELSLTAATKLYLEGKLEEAYEIISRLCCTAEDETLLTVYIMYGVISSDLGYGREAAKADKRFNELINQSGKYEFEKKLLFSADLLDQIMLLDQISDDHMRGLICFSYIRRKVAQLAKEDDKSGDIASLELISRGMELLKCPALILYVHIFLAVYYSLEGFQECSERHLEGAIKIAVERKWYTPLAEYSLTLDYNCLKKVNEDAYQAVKALSAKIQTNYIKTGIFEAAGDESFQLSRDSIRIAYKIAMNKTNKEIVEELGITEYRLRRCLNEIYERIGSSTRSDIKKSVLRNIVF